MKIDCDQYRAFAFSYDLAQLAEYNRRYRHRNANREDLKMWALVIVFGVLAAVIGGICGAFGGLTHRGDPVPASGAALLLVLVIGLAIFGKWLITSDIVTAGKLIAVLAVTFLPTGVLSLLGFARHGA